MASITVLWTVLPLFRHEAWWIRVFDFPRIQITVITLLVLAGYVAVSGWGDLEDGIFIIALSLCAVLQLKRIARYTPFSPRQLKSAAAPAADATLSVLVSNVYMPNRKADALIRLIRRHDPDVVLAVETDTWWESKLEVLATDYPFALRHPLDNTYGMHLYSKLRLIDREIQFLVEDDVPSMHAIVVLRNGHRMSLHCLHPAPPSPTENPTSAERDAELLLVAKMLDGSDRSAVVMGDLNDVAWSTTTRLFQKLSGLLDPRVGRGPYCTFHAKYPFLRWPLDHVFCSADFRLVRMARLDNIGSDHFPILAVVEHEPGVAEAQETPEATREERRRAAGKIDAVDAGSPAKPR